MRNRTCLEYHLTEQGPAHAGGPGCTKQIILAIHISNKKTKTHTYA